MRQPTRVLPGLCTVFFLGGGCTGCPVTGTTDGGGGGGAADAAGHHDAGGTGSSSGASADAGRDAGPVTLDGGPRDAAAHPPDAAVEVDAGSPFDHWPITSTGALDPVPGLVTPGATADGGCAAPIPVDPPDLEVGAATTHRFTGTVPGIAETGTFYVYAGNGLEIVGPAETDTAGAYAVSVPLFCGYNLVKLTWDTGTACRPSTVHRVYSRACTKMDLRITILWDAIGRDWELHLIRPGGRINDSVSDCTWTTCINGSPDWGRPADPSDDPHKDVDDVTAFGPESIYLPELETGVYTVMVEHWNASGDPASDGQAIINLAGQTRVFTLSDLAPMRVWTVATIDGTTVTEGGAVHDCSANWSGGCRDAIP
ncbi:MAG: hypothetical protein HY904_12995 [Deltaproteobacteria bacterium]|nr:hypothetical protein [Deltaproteobacteria bacterium]